MRTRVPSLDNVAIWVILATLAAVALWAVFTFNGLVRRKTMTAEAWSGIETQLKRRAALIPNLCSPPRSD